MAAAFLNGMNALENAPKPNSLSLGPKLTQHSQIFLTFLTFIFF
tara:strand:+ start:712 stop:843 length:132 start_codon:yes stop_codon:yes gene_type:complete